LYIGEKDPKQWNENGVFAKQTWNPGELEGLVDVTLLGVGAQTSSSVVVDVYSVCLSDADESNTIAITGLVEADFSVLTAGGAAQTITGITESATIPGRYTIAASATIVTGTVALVAPASLTTGLFDGTTTIAITIS